MNPKVDWYFVKNKKWQAETEALRHLAIAAGLDEELKWGCPCYTLGGKNLVLIHVFKEYCAFLFFKGALMKDPNGLLIQQTERVQAARQMRFTSLSQITKQKRVIAACIKEAIAVEKSGLKVPLKKAAEFEVAEEFELELQRDPRLKKAFSLLTPGRQRAYLLHFSQAKQSKTRAGRVEKYLPWILAGKGLDDYN